MKIDLLTVALADDDEDDRLLFEDAINELKIKTKLLLFKNGLELMNYLKKPDAELPQVLFLDLNMPVMDGMRCLDEIRRDSRLKNLSVAIYSTSSSEKDIVETYVRGANIYLTKPSDFKKLQNAIQKILSINWQFHSSNLDKDNFILRI
ncbi:response regulator [Zeaxanthinibacter enoshimensis]|uniref:Response regulator receiver domain-containing protein n=1 Tax=Zeaxanthinibacter enoshimensis TaxID=392009 RepID=A0A4R6TQG0_9FLAO|nr:response regulator [Zeaxanthinibacter enoshimensis]TDQ32353.1 response regulator receiver domain-containing protein [Zeaxanthinibacter enoshimensis]